MSILNLFFQMLTNAQRLKPAPRLALRPISLIFVCPKYSQNKQIQYPKSTPSGGHQHDKILTLFGVDMRRCLLYNIK